VLRAARERQTVRLLQEIQERPARLVLRIAQELRAPEMELPRNSHRVLRPTSKERKTVRYRAGPWITALTSAQIRPLGAGQVSCSWA